MRQKLVRQVPSVPPPTSLPSDTPQVWAGITLGILICLVIGAGVIGTFYTAGRNSFE
jgi:hypothetical protein